MLTNLLPHPWRGVIAASRGRQWRQTGIDSTKNIVTDGPVVTKANADGMLWMEDQSDLIELSIVSRRGRHFLN